MSRFDENGIAKPEYEYSDKGKGSITNYDRDKDNWFIGLDGKDYATEKEWWEGDQKIRDAGPLEVFKALSKRMLAENRAERYAWADHLDRLLEENPGNTTFLRWLDQNVEIALESYNTPGYLNYDPDYVKYIQAIKQKHDGSTGQKRPR